MPLLVLADDVAEPADEHVHDQREARQHAPRPAGGAQWLSSATAPSNSVKNDAEAMIGHLLEWGT